MSSATCILTNSIIKEGDRVVAVLTTPRRRDAPLPQEYAPVLPFHRTSAASFPIRGTYDSFGQFAPDPNQPSADLLVKSFGVADWKTMIETGHAKGLSLPRSVHHQPKTVPVGFAFAIEEFHDRLCRHVSPDEAISEIAALIDTYYDNHTDPDVRSRTIYRLLDLSENIWLFGLGELPSALARDHIGHEILAPILRGAIDRSFGKEVSLETSRTIIENEIIPIVQAGAELTSFEFNLRKASVTLQPSIIGQRSYLIDAKLALMVLERTMLQIVEKAREGGVDTPLLADIEALPNMLSANRQQLDDRQKERLPRP